MPTITVAWRERHAEVWCHCLVAHLALRLRRTPELELEAVRERLEDLVDPNTDLLYHGTRAWQAARQGDAPAALADLAVCRRVTGAASMLSVYAIYGFIGEIMALLELRAAGNTGKRGLRGLARGVLQDFRGFARPFPAAWPYVAYMRGCWLTADGRAGRGERLRARALRHLDLAVPADAFLRSLSVADH